MDENPFASPGTSDPKPVERPPQIRLWQVVLFLIVGLLSPLLWVVAADVLWNWFY